MDGNKPTKRKLEDHMETDSNKQDRIQELWNTLHEWLATKLSPEDMNTYEEALEDISIAEEQE